MRHKDKKEIHDIAREGDFPTLKQMIYFVIEETERKVLKNTQGG